MYKVKIKKACMECGGTYQEGGASKENMKINSHMGPVKKEEANIEVEKGESAFGDINGDSYAELMFFGGKRHHSGGTPVSVPPGTFIFSDTKKLRIKDADLLEKFFNIKNPRKSGYTPAEISKQYKNFNEYLETLKDPDSDNVKIATAYEMVGSITTKLGALALIQEAMKGFPDGVPSFAESAMGALGLSPEELGQAMQPDEEQGEMNQGPVEEMQEGPEEGEFRFGGLNQYQVAGKTKPNTFTDADLAKGLGKQISPLWNNTKEILKKEYAYVPQLWNDMKQGVNSMPNLIDEFNNAKDYAGNMFKGMDMVSKGRQDAEARIKKEEDAIKAKADAKKDAEAKAFTPDYIKYYKETHKGETPKYYQGEGLTGYTTVDADLSNSGKKAFTNKQYKELIQGLSKVKEKTDLGEYEWGEKKAKDYFNKVIDTYEKGSKEDLKKLSNEFNELDIPSSVGWMAGSKQDIADQVSTILSNRAEAKDVADKKYSKLVESKDFKNKYKNYINLLEEQKKYVSPEEADLLDKQISVGKKNLEKPEVWKMQIVKPVGQGNRKSYENVEVNFKDQFGKFGYNEALKRDKTIDDLIKDITLKNSQLSGVKLTDETSAATEIQPDINAKSNVNTESNSSTSDSARIAAIKAKYASKFTKE